MQKSAPERIRRKNTIELMETIKNKPHTNQNNKAVKSAFFENGDNRNFSMIIAKRGFTHEFYDEDGVCFTTKDIFAREDVFIKESMNYFQLCDEMHQIPLMTTFACYLGTTSEYLYKLENKIDCPVRNAIKTAKEIIHGNTQAAMVNGKLNPMGYVFLAGNYWGMKDVRHVDVNVGPKEDTLQLQETREETMKALQLQAKQDHKEESDCVEAEIVSD